ncbi:MAG: hypothetical protein KF700_12070, partial [Hyphomonadaceae bacterium]|nr:hypothetical protein [Hyphomonadaceae bacterium]
MLLRLLDVHERHERFGEMRGQARIVEAGGVCASEGGGRLAELAFVGGDQAKLRELMIGQAALRDLPAAYIIDHKGAVKLAVLEDNRIPYIVPPERLMHAAE